MIKPSVSSVTGAQHINIVRDWTEELKRLVPTE